MREIKFRAIKSYNNEWVYGGFVKVNDSCYVVPSNYFELDGHHLRCDSDLPVFVEEETIGQYTGLRDINGVKIFEGDIVENHLGDICIIKWLECGARFCLYSDESYDNFTENLIKSEEMKIIGNIHQNKELLE